MRWHFFQSAVHSNVWPNLKNRICCDKELKKKSRLWKSLLVIYDDKIQPLKVDIPEHSGPSSQVLCQASEDRPRLSVEVAGREGRSLWQEKEGDRKEAKKIRAGHRSSGKKLLISFTWMMEPRTVVHTKRRYGNCPVSLVKHAQENCQKIQNLKECNRFSMRFKCHGYRVYKWECIKMFFLYQKWLRTAVICLSISSFPVKSYYS